MSARKLVDETIILVVATSIAWSVVAFLKLRNIFRRV